MQRTMASIRGYNYEMSCKRLSFCITCKNIVQQNDVLWFNHYTGISDHLYYLEQNDLIKFSNKSNSLNALNNDAIVRLTASGIRFIENGGNPEMGIDL